MDKYLLLKILSVLIAAFSQVLLKKSANTKYDNVIKEYLNPLVIIAYVIFGISTILSILSLKGITIGYSMIIESLNYILIPIIGNYLFKEKINIKHIVGIVLIVIGILVFNI